MKLSSEKDFFLYKDELIIAFRDFLLNQEHSKSVFFKELNFTYQKIYPLLNKRFVKMDNNYCFDKRITACWIGLCGNFTNNCIQGYEYDLELEDVIKEIKECFNDEKIDLPTKNELLVLTNLDKETTPFPIINQRPVIGNYLLYKYRNRKDNKWYIRTFNMSRLPLRNISEIEGVPLPLYRLYKEDTEEVDNKQLFLLWIVNKLKPVEFEDEFYNTMLNFKISFEDLKIYKNRKDIIEDGIIGIDFGN